MKKVILPLIVLGIILFIVLYAKDNSNCKKNRHPVIEKVCEESCPPETKVEMPICGVGDADKSICLEETSASLSEDSTNYSDYDESGTKKNMNEERTSTRKDDGLSGTFAAGRNGRTDEPKSTASPEQLPVADREAGRKVVVNSADSLCTEGKSQGIPEEESIGMDVENGSQGEEDPLEERLPVSEGMPISSCSTTEDGNAVPECGDTFPQVICAKPDLAPQAGFSPESGPENMRANEEEFSVVESKRPLFALKTNMLFDVALMPNVEIEVPIGKRWSVNGEYMFPWWVTKDNRYCLQILAGGVEGRYWLGSSESRKRREALTGHFIGLYAGGGEYDLQWKESGYQGEFFIAAGLSYGWSTAIARNLHLEMSVGIGVMQTHYRHYHAIDNYQTLLWQENGKYTWIGPTKAKISLVWVLNRKAAKGGAR